MRSRNLFAGLVAVLALSSTGCIKKMILDGQIEGTRKAAPALDTVADYELAQRAASAGLAQFEGMHRLAPDNKDGLFLLTKGWGGYAYAFAEDEYEAAVDAENDALADYHKRRALNAYDRAIFYGIELIEKKAGEGEFKTASQNDSTLKAWLADKFTDPEDAPNLFWLGYAWLARTNLIKDEMEAVANLFVGAAVLERSVALDPTYNFYSGTIALAAYHSRSPMAEMDQGKQMFETAIQKTGGKALAAQYNFASKYYCVKGDKANYLKLLNEVLQAPDPDPNQRLTNTVMKRRAMRWTGPKRMGEVCGMY